jgi:hypothetical protein
MSDEVVKLLSEIRELLIPVSAVAMPQYEKLMQDKYKGDIALILEIVGRSAKQLGAAKVMDGKSSPAQIKAATGFDSSNFSKFVKKLKDAKVLTIVGDNPLLSVMPDLIPWPRAEG